MLFPNKYVSDAKWSMHPARPTFLTACTLARQMMTLKIKVDVGRTKIAFQYDAYRPLVNRISRHALRLGGSSCRGWYPSMHWGRPPPALFTEFLTHATENITLPQTSFARR